MTIACHLLPLLRQWRRVSLRGLRVTDWTKAAAMLEKQRTENLSLVDLILPTDLNSYWHQMTPILPRLSSLKEITFGFTPAAVLHSVCEKLPNLEVMRAEYVIDSNGANASSSELLDTQDQQFNRSQPVRLDFAKILRMPNLKTLHLRGLGGLKELSIPLNGQLTQLSTPERLRDLSLINLQLEDESDFDFLDQMQGLKTLAIGSCACWTAETYEKLGKLTGLTSLHLREGGKELDGLYPALQSLVNLRNLELISFAFMKPPSDDLEKKPNLKTLCISPDTTDPDTAAIVNSNAMSLVSRLGCQDTLQWGVLCSHSPEDKPLDLEKLSLPFLPSSSDQGEGQETDSKREYLTGTQVRDKLKTLVASSEVRIYEADLKKVRRPAGSGS